MTGSSNGSFFKAQTDNGALLMRGAFAQANSPELR
jgi:hypothetical protein